VARKRRTQDVRKTRGRLGDDESVKTFSGSMIKTCNDFVAFVRSNTGQSVAVAGWPKGSKGGLLDRHHIWCNAHADNCATTAEAVLRQALRLGKLPLQRVQQTCCAVQRVAAGHAQGPRLENRAVRSIVHSDTVNRTTKLASQGASQQVF
jgi:hypothetical protein